MRGRNTPTVTGEFKNAVLYKGIPFLQFISLQQVWYNRFTVRFCTGSAEFFMVRNLKKEWIASRNITTTPRSHIQAKSIKIGDVALLWTEIAKSFPFSIAEKLSVKVCPLEVEGNSFFRKWNKEREKIFCKKEEGGVGKKGISMKASGKKSR